MVKIYIRKILDGKITIDDVKKNLEGSLWRHFDTKIRPRRNGSLLV